MDSAEAKILAKYGKVKTSISRDVIVPSSNANRESSRSALNIFKAVCSSSDKPSSYNPTIGKLTEQHQKGYYHV